MYIFVINKSDRPDADLFVKNLRLMLAPSFSNHPYEIAIIKTIASEQKGVDELLEKIMLHQQLGLSTERKLFLLAEKAFHLIQNKRMKDIDKQKLKEEISKQLKDPSFNLYRFVLNK